MQDLLNKFFEYKITALLHDPVDKGWLIASGEDHEKVAKEDSRGILSGTDLETTVPSILASVSMHRGRHIVGRADMLASSIDRWVISILTTYKGRYVPGVFRVKKANELKNIFNPRFTMEFKRPNNKGEFIKELSSILRRFKDDRRLLYHLLYALYEIVFYSKAGKIDKGFIGSVADTRCPTHTVFDHVYATATMINIIRHVNGIVEGNEPCDFTEGYVVLVDLAGIQRMLLASRKLRDLWISSWLASTLTWISVWPLVLALGPDVLVKPSPRNNPFYYISLLGMVKNRVKDRDAINLIEKYFIKAVGKLNKGIPRFGVIPTQVLLILPSIDIIREGLRTLIMEGLLPKVISDNLQSVIERESDENLITKVIQNIYMTSWSVIVNKVKNEIIESQSKLAKAIRNILEEYNRWSVDKLKEIFELLEKRPPLPIRIIVLNIRDIMCKDRGKIESYEVYDKIIEKVLTKLNEASTLKYDYPPVPPTTRMYRVISKGASNLSKRGFEYCSVCGVMPAILRMPSINEWESEWRDKLRELAPGIDIERVFAPGERLCAYDLIKRLISVHDVLNDIIKELLYETIGEFPSVIFPSTAHIALADFYHKLKEAIMKNPQISKKLRKLVSEQLEGISLRPGRPYGYLGDLSEQVLRKFGSGSNEYIYYATILSMDPERIILSSEGRRALRELTLINDIKQALSKTVRLNTYLAIIKADADNMTKLLRGEVKEAIGLEPIDYIIEAVEGGIKRVIDDIVKGREEEAYERLSREYRRHGVNEEVAKTNLNSLKLLLSKLRSMNRIILTPTYHISLSRALMICTLIDQSIVESDLGKGFIVYSGGDDLLALTPVSTSLDVVINTRRAFSIGSYSNGRFPGFMNVELLEKLGLTELIVPLIVTGGRSYSLALVHYRYPLYMGLSISTDLLNMKDKIEWVISEEVGGNVISKDILYMSYVPRGLKELKSVLPLRASKNALRICELVELLNRTYREIEEGKLSRSLIYDLQREKEVLRTILSRGEYELYDKLLRYVVSRNLMLKGIDVDRMSIMKLFRYSRYVVVRVMDEGKKVIITPNVIDSIRIFDSAVRGVES